jgi:lambda repressor-like predicted transcriptional regulator
MLTMKRPVTPSNTKVTLTQVKASSKIQDVRAIVIARAKAKGLTAYRLAKLTGITEQTLLNFLDKTHHMRSDKLGLVFAALELEVKPKE